MSEPNRALGLHFITSHDQRRGGPDPAICDPGYTAKINGNVMNLQGHQDFLAAVYAAFPDLNHLIEDTVADEEKVAVRFILEGTHQAEYRGIAPTGKRIHVEGIGILQVENGKVVELRGVLDEASMMRQLGG